MDFELSKYQQEILDYYIKNPTKNMMVNALAGSGKSSTACILTEHTTAYSVYLAFNASIVEEFKTKITNPKVKVYTMHSLAYAIMNYNLGEKVKDSDNKSSGFGIQRLKNSSAKLDNLKIYKILDEEIVRQYGKNIDFMKKYFYKENFATLYNLCHLSLIDCEDSKNVEKLIDSHTLFESYGDEFYEKPTISECTTILKNAEAKSLILFNRENSIDFTDMLWITYWKLKNKEWELPFWSQFTNIIADEVQDFNPLQQKFMVFLKRKNGRYVLIGDENQAIYMWASADAHSYSNLKKMFAPIKEFDLPVCYRCAKSHLSRVNHLFEIPIQPRPTAPDGTITTIRKSEIAKIVPKLSGTTMIISRKNKWLSNTILDLAKVGVPIYIEDVDFVKSVEKIVANNKAKTLKGLKSNLNKAVEDYTNKIRNLTPIAIANTEEVAEELVVENTKIDNTNFVLTVLDGYLKSHPENTSKEFFESYLKNILNTKPSSNAVRICSVHKSKGLEADNVFVLNEAKVCRDFRNSPEQNIQERNLSYISITRAKENLYLVKEESNEKGKASRTNG